MKEQEIRHIAVVAVLLTGIFIVDLSIPLGVAAAVPYIAVVLFGLKFSKRETIIYFASLASILTLLGYFFSPPGGELWKVFANRFLSLFAIWTVASVCYAYKGILSGIQESREMLRIVLDAVPVRVFWKDRDLRYLGCNKRFAADAGKKSADEIFGAVDSQLPWRNQEGFYRSEEKEVLETGRTKLNVDEPQSGSDANLHWRRTSRIPLTDSEGQIMGVIGTYEDVTEENHLRVQLQKEEKFNKLVLNNAFDAIIAINADDDVLSWNKRAESIFGWLDSEVLGKKLTELIIPSDKAALHLKGIERFLFSGEKGLLDTHVETVGRRKDGSELPVELTVSAVKTDDQYMFIGILRDISQKLISEEELRKLSQAVKQSPATVIITDRRGNIEFVNSKFTELTGYSFEEAKGKNPRFLKSGFMDPDIYGNLWETLLAGKEWKGEFLTKKKDGGFFWEMALISPITNAKGETTHFLAVKEDITSLKEAQANLKAYADELSHLYKSEKELREREEEQKKALEAANAQLKLFANDLNLTLQELESAHMETLQCLAMAAEFKDEDTGKHILRISRYSELLASELGLPDSEVRKIALASPMHDIGKVGVPDTILHKNGKLTEEEFEQIKLHTVVGEKILQGSKSLIAQMAREIALSHHEKWNGQGYPKGISGRNIPLAGRIVSLVDCFDALMDKRPYKDPYPKETVIAMILEEKNRSFDPEIVEAFAANFDKFLSIYNELKSAQTHDFRLFELSERDRNGYPLYAVRKPVSAGSNGGTTPG
ncbi:MAG: PAS domain S-box protein [Nitrospinae bacterium]|nr:PAS domain S-box protein [Nitrospinota bacterium]